MQYYLSAKARKVLQKVICRVLEEPKRVDMNDWVQPSGTEVTLEFCNLLDTANESSVTISGLWPVSLRLRLLGLTPGTPKYAQVVADRIQHLLDTGE